MARQTKVRNLDKAIDKLFKNYENALTDAMKYASEIAKDDIDKRLIDVTLSFFLIDVIIFLLMLAYLKLKSKLRRK